MEVDSNSNKNDNTTKDTSDQKKDVDARYDVEFTRAIKENHGHDIVDCAWCPYGKGSYFATVGSNQLNVYDMNVRGNFFSTLLNYRNWDLKIMLNRMQVLKKNRERHHPELLKKKTFKCLCWMKRWRDYWIIAGDSESNIHIISLTYSECINIIKMESNIIQLIAHPIYENILITINENNKCKFIKLTDIDKENGNQPEIIYTFPEKICHFEFNKDDENKFIVVLTNGIIREYQQQVEISDDIKKEDEDDDLEMNNNQKKKNDKKMLVIDALNQYKSNISGNKIIDIHYCGISKIIFLSDETIFKHIDLSTNSNNLLHQWKVSGKTDFNNICKFDVNDKNDCIVYGNAEHQVLLYDIIKKKLIRKVDPGRGRKFPFLMGTFCKNNHKQSVLMISDSVIIKYDPLELVRDYFPSTADFAVQFKNGFQCFAEYKAIKYD